MGSILSCYVCLQDHCNVFKIYGTHLSALVTTEDSRISKTAQQLIFQPDHPWDTKTAVVYVTFQRKLVPHVHGRHVLKRTPPSASPPDTAVALLPSQAAAATTTLTP